MFLVMTGVVLAFICMACVRLMMRYVYRGKFFLEPKKRALTVDEQNFLKGLEFALDDEYYIMPKVRFLGISKFRDSSNSLSKRLVNHRIGDMCADFVLCKKPGLSIEGVVELEKLSKQFTKKQKLRREKMVNQICNEMGIKVFYFDGRQDYPDKDIRRLVTGRARRVNDQKLREEQSMMSVEEHSIIENASSIEQIRSCPKCYSEVVTKIAVKGDFIGEKFIMCRKHPYCDYKISVKDTVIKDIQRKEDVSRKKAGYRSW